MSRPLTTAHPTCPRCWWDLRTARWTCATGRPHRRPDASAHARRPG